MIDSDISAKVLTIGPSPEMKGGIAQVLETYFAEVIPQRKFIAETVNGNAVQRIGASFTAFFKLIATLASDRNIKIVHLHTATKVSFPRSAIYARVARMMGRKTITHVHGSNFDDYYRRHPRRVTKALRSTDCVVALSDSWLRFFKDEIGVDNVVVIPNIISSPSALAAAPKGGDGKVHALFLGLLGPRKGIFDLLEVLHRQHGSLKGRFVLHVGGNGEVERFKETVARLDLGDVVEFHGWVRAHEKERLLSLSSLYILPSYGEGLPISILEAMAYGNAILSTTVGGIPEVVDDSNGVLVTPGDLDALSAAIGDLVADPARLHRLGEASRGRIAPHLPAAVARKLQEMYRKVDS